MSNGLRDLRFGWRILARNKGFTAVAVLALALGIGPNVAIFSVIYATFLAPLPYPHPEQLVVVWTKDRGEHAATRANDYLDYVAQSKSFERLDYESFTPVHVTDENHEVMDGLTGGTVTGSEYTQLFGLKMALGRDLQPSDDIAGNDHVALLTNRLWRERYHSNPQMVGKAVRINDQPYTVVGVLAPGMPDRNAYKHVIVPAVLTPGGTNDMMGMMLGRLKVGVSLQQAAAELTTIRARLPSTQQGGVPPEAFTVGVEPLRNDFLDKKLQRNLWLLLAAVGFVLLIACANLANLLLARGASRQRELALRSALGATRKEVFSQLVIESFALAAAGGLIGIALGWGLIRLVMAIMPDLATQSAEIVVQVNVPVLAFGVAASIVAGVLAGCAPAWQATRVNLSEILKQNSRSTSGASRMHLQRVLVVCEFALALTLLAGAGMTLHSFWNLTHVDLGVRTDHVLTGWMEGPPVTKVDPEKVNANTRVLLSKLNALPGVESATVTTSMPLQGHDNVPFRIDGQAVADSARPTADFEEVTPGYFRTFGVQLIHGRLIEDSDRLDSPPVIVVSESFVKRYLPGRNPLEQRLVFDSYTSDNKVGPPFSRQIVGVFHDVRNGEHLSDDVAPEMFVPFFQQPWPYSGLAVRTMGNPVLVSRQVRDALREIMPGVSLNEVQTLQQSVDKQLTGDRFSMLLFGSFAVLALGLAALGIYGVIAFAVAQRGHEIGLRMALGAQQSDMLLMVLTDAVKLSLYGIGFGLVGVLALGLLLRTTLFGVRSVDVASFGAVSLILLGVAVLASLVPARRSSQIDPMVALRQE